MLRTARVHLHHRNWGGLLPGAVLLAAVMATACADEIRVGGTGGALGTVRLLAQAYAQKQPQARIAVLPSLGSTGGIKAVLAGKIELAVSARPLKEPEMLQGASQIELGCTPVVLATAASSKVSNLGTTELVDILTGKTDHWPDGQTIRLVLRPADEIDTQTLQRISPEMPQALLIAAQRKGLPFAVSDQDAADTLEKVPGALGTTTLAQLLTEHRALKALRLDLAEPNARNVRNGSYPMCRSVFLVVGPQTSAAARQFAAFVQSGPAAALLRRNGYVQH